MPRRLAHGETITIEQFNGARESLATSVADVPLAFAAAQPVDLKDFDFLFPDLQNDPNSLLPEAATTPANLVRLGKTMIDAIGNDPAGDSDISAIMTYFLSTTRNVLLSLGVSRNRWAQFHFLAGRNWARA